MAQVMHKVVGFCRCIDTVNDYVGKVISMAFVPLVLIVMTEVVLRYFFNRPTLWAWDVIIQLAALLAIVGGGYTLLYRGHVIVDVFVGRLSPHGRAIVDLVTSVFFFLSIGVLLWIAVGEGIHSVQIREVYTSIFGPPIYPLRVAIFVGIFLLLLQGIVKFIGDLITVTQH